MTGIFDGMVVIRLSGAAPQRAARDEYKTINAACKLHDYGLCSPRSASLVSRGGCDAIFRRESAVGSAVE
jgi:hypothetical protein